MRYHSARVVLGACLVAASAAAQAPSSLSSPAVTRGDGLFERAPLGDESPFGTRSLAERFAPQGEPDYSLRGQFLVNHGEFMDRRERYRPDFELRARVLPNQSIHHEPGSFDMLGYDFDGSARVLVSTDGYLTLGAYYLGRHYTTSTAFGTSGNASGIGDETLVGVGAKVGFGVFLSDNVLFEMQTEPGAWSDLDDTLHHEDFDFPSHALFTFRTIDNFFFKVGARYNQVFEDAPWLPYLGFSWEITEGFRLDVLAPEHLEMSWWPNTSLGLLFGAEVTGAEYRVHTAESLNQSANARVQEVVAYLGLLTRFNDYASFMARAGLVIAGDYDLTTGASGFNNAEGSLDQGFYAEVSFGLSF